MRAYPAYRTQREGTHKQTEIFDGVYPSKGQEAREEMKKEQLRVPQGNPREEREDTPLRAIGKTETEGKGTRDEPKKPIGREYAPPVHMAEEHARYNAQDDDVVMEDELLAKARVREQGRKQQEKEKRRDIPMDGNIAHKATDQVIEA
ncbi:hypothetical protein P692DRAFT_20814946 [Suillus brevipes Sb2]|nr:hypothetical protein P692DRAFT_20814946 [Suillus brevipes Sb2]